MKKERLSQSRQMLANEQNPIDRIEAGDIGAAVGFKDIRTGDTLCAENAPIVFEAIEFPDPVIGLAIEPKKQAELDKLGVDMAKISEEDPTFKLTTDQETDQIVNRGIVKLYLQIIV